MLDIFHIIITVNAVNKIHTRAKPIKNSTLDKETAEDEMEVEIHHRAKHLINHCFHSQLLPEGKDDQICKSSVSDDNGFKIKYWL